MGYAGLLFIGGRKKKVKGTLVWVTPKPIH